MVSTWPELTRALESQFGPSPFDCPMAELFKLQQTGSVSDYYLKLMSLANRSLGLSDEAFLNCFISGLNADIRRDVVAMTPRTLLRAIALSKLRRKKGLCYFYDEKFSFSHRCPNRQFLFLQLEEDDIEDSSSLAVSQVVHEAKIMEPDDHHLSLNALKGGVGVGTIRFLAYIDRLPMTMLIDGGSSDNFL
ncbi:uncharacterized protein LOC113862469 [Abrus precatorius]|uniref:Uncharacterized protein LOC113862469 n=1 Tax=Abrus precatorius TaxID=3816 RepID=A0A8B8L9E4_ABRPR|nr:uncharacterized protein LOC113862469 [Abrus precatorius]